MQKEEELKLSSPGVIENNLKYLGYAESANKRFPEGLDTPWLLEVQSRHALWIGHTLGIKVWRDTCRNENVEGDPVWTRK